MSVSGETARIIRVFVSSPGDVNAERDVMDEVVTSINRTDGQTRKYRLELFRWEDSVTPQIGPDPQQVVDAQTPAYDIYVGIMSTRFGGGGTTKEFQDAMHSWQGSGSPWVTFYFDAQPKLTGDPEQAKQFVKVCQFRSTLEKEGIVATYSGVRGSADGFFEKVSDHLRKIVAHCLTTQSVRPTANTQAATVAKPAVPPEYTEWLLIRCEELELMGLELKHGSGVRLNHVYTPLATSARPEDDQRHRVKRGDEPIEEGRDPARLLLRSLDEQSLYVSGDPGSGKSTFCRWVTWLTCKGILPHADVPAPENYQETFPNKLRGRLPVLIRLRDFWQHLPPEGVRSVALGGLEQALQQWLAQQKFPSVDWACLNAHLEHGSTLLMLDGIDEVPPVRRVDDDQWYPREMLLTGLAAAVSRWSMTGNHLLVTSRPYGLDSQQQQNLRLPHAPILGLDQQLQALLVRRWFIRLKEGRDLGMETADAMLDHLHVERGLDELAVNPLLLTAMCIIYDEGKRLPHDKYLLYDRIVDTVLHKRYPAKERTGPIRGRLAAVALGMHTGQGLGEQRTNPEAAASDREIDLLLQAYQQLDGSTDKGLSDTVRVREDLLSQSGLLVSRGDGGASFYHLSIQEFLTAERLFLLSGRERAGFVDLFLTHGLSVGWRNTLPLLFGCLVSKFSPHVGVEWLRDVADRLQLPALDSSRRGAADGVWNLAIVLGDCLQVLLGREAAVPDDLSEFFQGCLQRAIDQEIAVKDRHTLAVALGQLGDPRVEPDLRIKNHPDEHPGYVPIRAGTYVYGDKKEPSTIDEPFWLSKYPVTNSQYALFVDDDGYGRQELWTDAGWSWLQESNVTQPVYWRDPTYNGPNQPVVGVSWWEADAFARWIGEVLPTERQWEAAARGPEGWEYPWGDDWENGICNSDEAGLGSTSAVGIFPRSRSQPFGLEDLAGNVWEWCVDQVGDWGRVIRGGGWDMVLGCRAALRGRSEPQGRWNYLGFRVAAVPPGGQPRPGQEAEPGA